MIKQSAQAIQSNFNRNKTITRPFFKIADVLPDKTKKAYGYVTPDTLTEDGKKSLNEFYQATEPITNGHYLSKNQIKIEIKNTSHLINQITHELNKANPDFEFKEYDIVINNAHFSLLHDDADINVDLILILPISPKAPQTFFFEKTDMFHKNTHITNSYMVKEKISFRNAIIDAHNNIPIDAMATVFSPIGTDKKPLVHCAPFDIQNSKNIYLMIKNGLLKNALLTELQQKRCLIAWTIHKKNELPKKSDFKDF